MLWNKFKKIIKKKIDFSKNWNTANLVTWTQKRFDFKLWNQKSVFFPLCLFQPKLETLEFFNIFKFFIIIFVISLILFGLAYFLFFSKMKNNFKKIQNSATPPTNQGFDLVKSTKRLSFINLFLFQLGIINFMILTYFYIQQDITFRATGWFAMPENIHWYHIFLFLILTRMLIVFTTHRLTEYIKNFSLWTEKEKKNALYALAAINILTLPINLPLIGGFYAYMKGSEIISNNWFLGTFRRILNENERENLYHEIIQNFLEKIEASKEVKEKLKNWAIENTRSMLEKYDDGSAFATQYVLEKFENQKEFLQLEEIKNHKQAIKMEDLVDQTVKDQQGLFPWIFDKTINGLNYWNPFVTDPKTCAMAWILLLGTGFLILVVSKSNFISWDEIKHSHENIKANAESIKKQSNFTHQAVNDLTKGLKAQNLKINTNKMVTDSLLKEIDDTLNNHETLLKSLSKSITQTQGMAKILQAEISQV